jgi:hypothetical protein
VNELMITRLGAATAQDNTCTTDYGRSRRGALEANDLAVG